MRLQACGVLQIIARRRPTNTWNRARSISPETLRVFATRSLWSLFRRRCSRRLRGVLGFDGPRQKRIEPTHVAAVTAHDADDRDDGAAAYAHHARSEFGELLNVGDRPLDNSADRTRLSSSGPFLAEPFEKSSSLLQFDLGAWHRRWSELRFLGWRIVRRRSHSREPKPIPTRALGISPGRPLS